MKKFEMVYESIKNDIQAGRLKQGDALPSIRQLSQTFECSKGTIVKALDLLVAHHTIFSKPQSGFYVADNLSAPTEQERGYVLDTGNPKINLLGTNNIQHLLTIALTQYANRHLNVPANGLTSVLELAPDYLAEQSVYADSSNIYIIQGVMQILNMLSLQPFPNGKKKILIEEPTYPMYVEYLHSLGLPVITIKRDEHGLDMQELERIFKNEDIKFFYCIPRNHNPLGTMLSFSQRKRMMELAVKYDVYIVEDDYLGDAHKAPKYVPMHYLSAGQNSIYIRSFSKELPFVRFGFCVISKPLKEMFEEIVYKSYFISYNMPDLIAQATWEAYIKTSIYRSHTTSYSREISKKLHLLTQITSKWDKSLIKVIGGYSGLYCTLVLSSKITADTLVERLASKKVFVRSNRVSYYCREDYDNSIRLSIAQVSSDGLAESLEIIYQTILEMVP